MNPSVITLGILHKNLENFFLLYNIKTKKFFKLKTLKEYTLSNRVDVCILTNTIKSGQKDIDEFIIDNPEIVFIIITNLLPEKFIKNVYYLKTKDIEDHQIISHFLHNLITFVKEIHQREELTAMIIHDTRSPITSMIGYLELLDNDIFGKLNAGQSQIISNIMMLGDIVIELIEDLNIIYQLEQKELNLRKSTFDLIQIVEEVLVVLWIQADQKDIKIHKHIDKNVSRVYGDSGKIQRVLINLITNSIKFSPPKSKISVNIEAISDSQVKISISDSGPGIDEKIKDQIFTKYYQDKKNKQKDKGFGLGLYISKNIIEAHNGNLKVTNNKSSGSTFSFTLPSKIK